MNSSTSASFAETMGYSHPITAGRYGHTQFGNWGDSMSFKKYYVNSSCSVTRTLYGTTRIPEPATWGYRYWETATWASPTQASSRVRRDGADGNGDFFMQRCLR